MKTIFLGLFVAAALLQLGLTIHSHHYLDAHHESQSAANNDTDLPQPMRHLDPSSVPKFAPWPVSQPKIVQVMKTEEEPAKSGTSAAHKVQTPEEFHDALEVAFTTDNPPNASSAKKSASIVQGFSGPLAKGTHLRGVDCRATRCKIEIDFADQDADNHLMSEFFTILRGADVDVSRLGFTVATRDTLPDGTINATVHLFEVNSLQPSL